MISVLLKSLFLFIEISISIKTQVDTTVVACCTASLANVKIGMLAAG
jgi:hypothetical protein